jgi:hypothetical protein
MTTPTTENNNNNENSMPPIFHFKTILIFITVITVQDK